MWQAGVLDGAEWFSLDARFMMRFRLAEKSAWSGHSAANETDDPLPITLVAVDDRALTAFGSWPWPKELQGQVIEEILRLKPAVLGIDVIYSNSDPRDDPAFARRLRSDVPVVLAAAERDDKLLFPRLEFLAPNVSVGHTLLPVDGDGVLRRLPVHMNTPHGMLTPFGWEVAERAAGSRVMPPSDSRGRFLINYRAQRRAGYAASSLVQSMSVVELFNEGALEKIEGRIVLFGVATPMSSGSNRVLTPLRSFGSLAEVVVHAAVVYSALNELFVTQPSANMILIFLVLVTVASGICAFTLKPVRGGIAGIIISIAAMAASGFVFVTGDMWVPLTPVFGSISLAVFVGMGYSHISLEREARRTRATFERYVSPEVASTLLASPDLADVQGGRRPVSVLFADIRGFTSFAENEKPETVVRLLNDYFELMTASVQDHRGMVDKYVGDGMMAIFGAPLPTDDHPKRAVAAGLDMLERMEKATLPLPISIGIHTGEALVGSVGPWKRQEYTAVGDVVNVAFRLQQSANPNCLLLSAETIAGLSGDISSRFRSLHPLKVKGRMQPVEVYETP